MWLIITLFYIAIGLAIVLFTRAHGVIRKSMAGITTGNHPSWKVATCLIIVHSASVLLWPIFLRGWFAKPKTLLDALNENPMFQQRKKLFEAMSLMCKDGVDADEMPNGRGEFGMTPSNPIPCMTVFGSNAYLNLLRTPDGTKVIYERIGSVASDLFTHPVDAYEILHPNGQKLAKLFISPYQKRNSGKAPNGFKLATCEQTKVVFREYC